MEHPDEAELSPTPDGQRRESPEPDAAAESPAPEAPRAPGQAAEPAAEPPEAETPRASETAAAESAAEPPKSEIPRAPEATSDLEYLSLSTPPPEDMTHSPVGADTISTGTCSRCRHLTTHRSGFVWAGGLDALGLEQPGHQQPFEVVVVFCQCGQRHPGREDDFPDQGCGAFWWGPG